MQKTLLLMDGLNKITATVYDGDYSLHDAKVVPPLKGDKSSSKK